LGYGLEKGNIINGDDVGLGKTFESIMYAETTNSFPCLVVVPASVKYNWQEKWEEITGQKRKVSVIESKETKKRKNDWDAEVVVINYDILGKRQGKGVTPKFAQLVEVDWKMLIFDEAHFLKNKTAQRSKVAEILCKKEAIIQLLTGTATMSKPVELWNLLKLIKKETLIATDWYQFIRRFCGGYRGKFGWVTDGATNTLELNERLRKVCYIRREKRDVLDELPEITKQIIKVPITNKKEIEHAETDFIEFVKQSKGDEAAEKAMEAEHLVALGTLRKLSVEGKLKAIEQYLKDWKLAGNGKLVIFGIHKEELEYLADKFKSPLIAGGTSSKKKQEIVKQWISDETDFLFANQQSAGTGVDGLQTVCSNMLITELPWRPSDLTQVIGRLERSGQKNAITVTFLLNFDTIDSEMWTMLEEKEQVTEAVNKGVDVRRNNSGMRAVINKLLKKVKK
jgi:SWI/SNF-related matrix-associated actin-dependent regulator 1 of chromatin subfamily A